VKNVLITYTNRKGLTYTLCQGTTKTGKPRYYFARDPTDRHVVEEIPEGYEISESINGIVSLVKKRPRQILPKEVAAVKAEVERHPKSRNYRVNVRHDRIEIYELVGPDAQDMISALTRQHLGSPKLADRIRAEQERYGQFTPVMRFTLYDEETRAFYAERWCYRGSIDDWIHISSSSSVEEMAHELIPTLGTDAFFELY
jgi:hypothetical protein